MAYFGDTCNVCEHYDVCKTDEPCASCKENHSRNTNLLICDRKLSFENKSISWYDSHYDSTKIQPIEFMQSIFTPQEFEGFLKGNIIKYIQRLGKKDEPLKESAKILRYAQWLHDFYSGKTINPRDK